MKFSSYIPKREPRQIMFITEANTGYLELCDERGGTTRYDVQNGETALLDACNCAIYSLVKPKQLILFNDARYWQVVLHHGRPGRFIYRDTVTIYSWASFGPDPQAIMPFFDAMAYLDIPPFSLGTMAKNSWRRTLRPAGEWMTEWARTKGEKPIGRNAFTGGRKEALNAPANYEGAHYLDLPAAYVSAMVDPLPLHLRESAPEWCDDGIAYATVNVPQQSWNPLPRRITTGRRGTDFLVFGYGTTTGFFVISELRNAVENFGVEAKLERVWRGALFKPVFARWVEEIMPFRSLPSVAGLLAKQMSNRLWSQFGANPRWTTEVVSFLDSRGREKERITRRNGDYAAKTAFLSAIIASRVRVRLLNELAQAGAVYLDTDGGIIPRDVLVPGWSQKRVMDRVEIRASQAFRWCCPGCAEVHVPWHYSIAGVPVDHKFQETWWQAFGVRKAADIGPASVGIPAMDFADAESWLASDESYAVVPAEEF